MGKTNQLGALDLSRLRGKTAPPGLQGKTVRPNPRDIPLSPLEVAAAEKFNDQLQLMADSRTEQWFQSAEARIEGKTASEVSQEEWGYYDSVSGYLFWHHDQEPLLAYRFLPDPQDLASTGERILFPAVHEGWGFDARAREAQICALLMHADQRPETAAQYENLARLLFKKAEGHPPSWDPFPEDPK